MDADSGMVSVEGYTGIVAVQQEPRRSASAMASRLAARFAMAADSAETMAAKGMIDAIAWAAAGFACGIGAWFALAGRWQWLALIVGALGVGLLALAPGVADGRWPRLRRGFAVVALMVALGCAMVWAKSALVGTPPIAQAVTARITGTVRTRDDAADLAVVRITLATREPGTGRAIAVQLSAPDYAVASDVGEGAVVSLRARLLPPSPPMVPGARDMARDDWFAGIAATGQVFGPIRLLRPASAGDGGLGRARRALANHVLAAVPGSAGGIAATLVSGNRGGIAADDQQAMRDAGLTHLLAISGLHVSAVVAGVYLVVLRGLALWPWLALRLRLPLVASGAGALAGLGYTALTGAHLPTIRACAGALLVLGALALGRRALSLRMLGLAAMAVMLLWPEAVVGPSFQLSFGAVLTIIALHEAAPARRFLARREEAWWRRSTRYGAALLIGGLAINLALLPVALWHFHRAGLYGALANLAAIPLVTFVAMPLIAIALLLDCVGAGGPVWWAVGGVLNLLLSGTHALVSQPGAVGVVPAPAPMAYALFVGGALWMGLWRGRGRLLGLVPAIVATAAMLAQRPPDVLIGGDARTVAVAAPDGGAMVLSNQASRYGRSVMAEAAGLTGEPIAMPLAPAARCNADFCLVSVAHGGRDWWLLAARNAHVPARAAMAQACATADIVVAQVPLDLTCRPRLLKADRALLDRTGGLAIDLGHRALTTVAAGEAGHPWWRGGTPMADQ